MYTPSFNRIADRALLLEAMRSYSFAILVGPGQTEAPTGLTATHLPLLVKDEGESGIILGHFARANSHWAALAGRETLVIFPGPHSYVSPALYTEELSVPTWNYISIHAYGTLSLIEDQQEQNNLLEELIQSHDPAYLARWQAMPDGYRRTMLAGIMGFRIPISRIEGKFKLSQNRKPQEQANIHTAQATGTDDQQELARWMARLNLVCPEPDPEAPGKQER